MKEALGSLLVVDDDSFNLDIICPRLERRGYQVDATTDSNKALELIGKGSYDLILLDIMMPGVDGMQVLKETRQHRSRAVTHNHGHVAGLAAGRGRCAA